MLCGFPETRMPSWPLRSFVATFSVLFMIFTRPWSVKKNCAAALIAAWAPFNPACRPIKSSTGTDHWRCADDDLKLGKNLKLNGAKCDVIDGSGMFHVHWYSSVRELIVGLEKNSFAAVEYSVVAVVTSSLALLVFDFSFVGPFFTTGAARWLFVAAAGIQLFMMAVARARLLPLDASLAIRSRSCCSSTFNGAARRRRFAKGESVGAIRSTR